VRALARLRGRFNRLSGVTALALAAFALGFGVSTAWMRTEVPSLVASRSDTDTSAAPRSSRPERTSLEPAPALRLDDDVAAFARRVKSAAHGPERSTPLRATKEPKAAD